MSQIIVRNSAGSQWVERCPRGRVRLVAAQLRRAGFRIVAVIG